MNFNFGLLPNVETAAKKDKKGVQIENCLKALQGFQPFPERASVPLQAA